MLSLRDESPAGENRKWNAGRRARPQAEGGASRLLRGASRTPLACGHQDNASAGVPLSFFFICRFFLRHCRARPGNPCERKARSDLPIRLSEPQFSMDHRVKPGGDEEFCKTRARKTAPRERGCFPAPRSTATSTPARPCSASSPSPTSWGRIRTAAACCSAAMNSVYPARYDATERRRVQPSKIGAQGG
jgi:hypothetical protein